MAILFVSADLGYCVWARATLEQAAREGARFGVTGRSFDHMDHEESIRQVVRQSSSGILKGDEDSEIEVRYTATDSHTTFLHLEVKTLRRTPLAAVLGSRYPVELTAGCSNVMESPGAASGPQNTSGLHL